MMRKLLLIVLMCGLYYGAAAQNFQWAKQVAGSSGFNVFPRSVCSDAEGNVYVTGCFIGTADFNPGTATNNLTSNGGKDIFILKLDAGGNYVWAYNIGGTSDDEGVSIGFWQDTPNSYVFIAGTFRLSADFNPGAAVVTKTEAGSFDVNDLFFLTLKPDGTYQQCTTIGNFQAETLGEAVVDPSGVVYVTGSFSATVNFNPNGTATNVTSNGAIDAFLLRTDVFMNYFWVQKLGGTGNEYGRAVVDGAVVGDFTGTVDFDPGAGTVSLTAAGKDIFVYYFNVDNGNYQYVHKIGSTGSNDDVTSIAKRYVSQTSTTVTNEYVIAGDFVDAIDFEPGAGTVSQTPTGSRDAFVVKYTRVRNFNTNTEVSYTCNWANKIGATNPDEMGNAAFDATGNIYYTASVATGVAAYTPVIGKYAPAGTNVSFGGAFNPTPTNTYNQAENIYVSTSGEVYSIGYFTGSTIDFDPAGGAAIFNLTAASTTQNGYIQKMSTCAVASTPTIMATATTICNGQSTVLSVASGNLNGNNTWTWYRGSCGGTLVGTGSSITVSPNINTTYYVRGEGGCAASSGACSSGLTITVNIVPLVSSSTAGSRCGPGTVTLSASPSIGTINWYTSSSGGTAVGTGNSFTTPSISVPTAYYAEAVSNGCISPARTTVMAAVWDMYSVTGTTPGARCGSGTVTLGATVNGGTLNWYNSLTGGSSLGTGTSFTTPSIATTTTYYVDVTNNMCVSSPRVAITATVNAFPTVSSTTSASRCGTGTVILGANASAGTLHWYTASAGGSSLGSGTSFTTPSITATTNYYAEAVSNGCVSLGRTMATATVKPVPTVTYSTPASRCGPGSVYLDAFPSAGTLSWYAAPSGGTALVTGSVFNTPNISSTTTYYVEVVNDGCTSSPRISVTATITPLPVVTITPGSRCGTGTVFLGATSTAGTPQWYINPTSSVIATTTSFETPVLTANTTYYVNVTSSSSGCSSSREPVLAEVLAGPNLNVNVNAEVLTAAQSGAIYQWVDCNNGNSAISGATSQSYTATATGSYAVEVSISGCSVQSSSCQNVTVTVSGVNDAEEQQYFTCNNPVASELMIRYNEMPQGEVKISLFDLNGRLVKTITHTGDAVTINMEGMQNGMYIVAVTMGQKEIRKKIIKVN